MVIGVLLYVMVGTLLGVDRADDSHWIGGREDWQVRWLACVLAWSVLWPIFLPLLLVRR
jgi:hypothetical protein